MKGIIRKVVVSLLVILLILPNMSYTMAAADDSDNLCVEVSTSAASTYIEKELKFEHKGDLCENGPWDIEKANNRTIYAYEWDTYYETTSTTDSFWVGLYKMKWSKNGTLSYQQVNLSSTFTHRITGGDYVSITKQDSNGNLFVTYYGKYKNKNQEMLTVIGENGKIIRDYALNDKLKHFIDESTISICDIYIIDSRMVLYVTENHGSQDSIQTFNWKTGKRLSTKKIETLSSPFIIDGFIYGVRETISTNENADGSITNTSSYSLAKLSLDGKKELWCQSLPKGEMVAKQAIDDFNVNYNKFDYDIVGTFIYLCNSEGIFSADTSKENGEFSLIMSANNSKYLSNYYSIVDLKVISEKCLYMLSIAGEDEEWPTDLGVYTLN